MSQLKSPLKTLTVLALLSLCGACSLMPSYERTSLPVADQYPSGDVYGETQASGSRYADDIDWREVFVEPRLQRLIQLALDNNRDLRVAALNVEAARAQYQIQGAALFPSIDATADASRGRFAATNRNFASPGIIDQYSVGVGFTAYELDFFGRIRSLKEQALQQYFASAEARKNTQISLVAEVSNAYLTERALAEQLTVARQTLASQQSSYELTKISFEYGNSSELDFRSAESQIETIRANLSGLERQRAQAINALQLLVGNVLPDDLPPEQPLAAQEPILADLAIGVPSELLTRRPDIRQAENQLKAANANIGAARAAFFPSIQLTTSIGTARDELNGLFKSASAVWSFAPQITLPIFNAGRNQANLDLALLQKDINIARYEKTIQVAFREVADALAARATLEQQIASVQRLVAAEQKRNQLSELRYRNGIDNYLQLLDAQRSLYTAQQRLIELLQLRMTNLVTLYKALGGGWSAVGPK